MPIIIIAMKNPVVHFEIPADDTARASEFYHKAFGWEIMPFPEMKYTGLRSADIDEKNNNMPTELGRINGGMYERSADLPVPSITVNVPSIDEAIERVKTAGGSVVREKVSVGGMGFIAYIKDTEGNVVGMWEDVPKA